MQFVRLPPGAFLMGFPDEIREHEPLVGYGPHPVRISKTFAIGMYEVSRSQFRALSNNKSPTANTTEAPDLPMTDVTWYAAVSFCERLSDLRAERAAGRRYRLPTEAEWEYACRGGSHEPFSGRPQPAGLERTKREAIQPSGSYRANGFGIFDMGDNAWEWCADWSDENYYLRSPLVDPPGPASGILRVVRGRDWVFSGFNYCYLTRDPMPPRRSSPLVGFRVVCEEQESLLHDK